MGQRKVLSGLSDDDEDDVEQIKQQEQTAAQDPNKKDNKVRCCFDRHLCTPLSSCQPLSSYN
jgi:hypothetical protein